MFVYLRIMFGILLIITYCLCTGDPFTPYRAATLLDTAVTSISYECW